jgi:hypothetical protein
MFDMEVFFSEFKSNVIINTCLVEDGSRYCGNFEQSYDPGSDSSCEENPSK